MPPLLALFAGKLVILYSMKKYIYAALLSATLFTSCGGDEPAPIPNREPEVVARTVLVYQVANQNGLAGNSTSDIREMIDGAAAGQIPADGRVLVFNRRSGNVQVLMELKKTGLDTLAMYSDALSSVSSDRMREVFHDVVEKAPAESYGLILWGHGSGWMQDGKERAPKRRSYGGDNLTEWMNMTTLASTLAAGPGFDFVYFDCCYMAGVEVAYELAPVAPYIAFSAMEIAAEGMPYHRTLGHFFEPMPQGVVNAASTTVDYYRKWKEAGRLPEYSLPNFTDRYCTMSVVDSRRVDALAEATARIYEVAPDHSPADMEPQPFGRFSYAKLYFDFGKYVSDLCLTPEGAERFDGASAKLDTFKAAMDDCVLYNGYMDYVFGGATPIKSCSGLTTYIPENADALDLYNYTTLSWYSDIASKLTFK